VNQEESEQNEVDGIKNRADSTGKVMHNDANNNKHSIEHWLTSCFN